MALIYTMAALRDRGWRTGGRRISRPVIAQVAGQRHVACYAWRMTDPVIPQAIPIVIPVSSIRPSVQGGQNDPPADGGPPVGPDQARPIPVPGTFEDFLRGLNPLHHLPVVGTIYRAVTGESVPAVERIAVSGITAAFLGGPFGMLGTILAIVGQGLLEMGPDPTCPSFSDPESGTKNQAAAAANAGMPMGSG